ncbi:beta-ketoacyl-ACP reductase [Marinicauda pacifica]|uniref:3-oxoacyl-[acyl-carrier-protein] reductase n=1 Tax=Marinicauda pacifica TaxID=1133559 RepID=A0A4S2HE64_9PROT|nr:3-oxoacyl-[acyl-carrier-protein] reductase [Marinicauda pacifica]TGY94350.1 3-oxoacyl-[acyl-carrier-protein] reductase [Marinicauda pacifica]GGE35063.1 beta-ketoacyl-ACP reductase [Marinicauda pacifica]
MFDLSGKKALVTGATGGLGGDIARALHAQGASVAISGTREEKLQELASELGERVEITPCNLGDAASVDALPKQASEALGGLDILISNAGVTRDQLLMRMKDEDWETVMRVNLEAHYRLCKASMRGMMKARWGRIIGITSIVGVTGNPGQTNYAASKAGMIGFTKALAQEVASRGVTANCVAPGFIASPMTDALNDEQKQAILAKIPAGDLGSGADIASACVYLASDEAGYVTGQTLHVNGGMAMI